MPYESANLEIGTFVDHSTPMSTATSTPTHRSTARCQATRSQPQTKQTKQTKKSRDEKSRDTPRHGTLHTEPCTRTRRRKARPFRPARKEVPPKAQGCQAPLRSNATLRTSGRLELGFDASCFMLHTSCFGAWLLRCFAASLPCSSYGSDQSPTPCGHEPPDHPTWPWDV